MRQVAGRKASSRKSRYPGRGERLKPTKRKGMAISFDAPALSRNKNPSDEIRSAEGISKKYFTNKRILP